MKKSIIGFGITIIVVTVGLILLSQPKQKDRKATDQSATFEADSNTRKILIEVVLNDSLDVRKSDSLLKLEELSTP